jgi:hypothetical protein
MHVRFAPKADKKQMSRDVRLVPKAAKCVAASHYGYSITSLCRTRDQAQVNRFAYADEYDGDRAGVPLAYGGARTDLRHNHVDEPRNCAVEFSVPKGA